MNARDDDATLGPPPSHETPRSGIAWGWLGALGGFVAYAAWLAPPDDPALTHALLRGAFTGRFGGVDPSVAGVFCLLGVTPAIAAAFVLRDGARRAVPAWPFAIGAFAVGAFALLPWLALRGVGEPRPEPRPAGAVRRMLARPVTGWALFAGVIAIGAWSVTTGSFAAYARAFHATSMVHVMTLDLGVSSGLLMLLVEEARAPGLAEPRLARWARFVPLLGSAAWNAIVRRAP